MESSIKITANFETTAWKWMRYSAFLLIPLVWGHVILQDVVVGVHAMGEDPLGYVTMRWANLGWRIYDAFLLGFAFAHGVNGLRQVATDFIHGKIFRRIVNIGLLVLWASITIVGAIALIGGVRQLP